MATRFPQSATSVAYRIKAAWADKIHAIWWAAGADSVHALRSGENATTVITRSASGATFDTENGVIVGDINSYFTDTESGLSSCDSGLALVWGRSCCTWMSGSPA